MHLNYVAGF